MSARSLDFRANGKMGKMLLNLQHGRRNIERIQKIGYDLLPNGPSLVDNLLPPANDTVHIRKGYIYFFRHCCLRGSTLDTPCLPIQFNVVQKHIVPLLNSQLMT